MPYFPGAAIIRLKISTKNKNEIQFGSSKAPKEKMNKRIIGPSTFRSHDTDWGEACSSPETFY